MEVLLSNQELMTAATVGVRRQISAMAAKRTNWGVLESTEVHAFDNHIIGAMAELATARHFNLFWADSVGRVNGRDVGGIIEVRCRRLVGGGGLDLAMRPKDIENPETPFLLVHERMPSFTLVGWIFGSEAREIGVANAMTGLHYVKPEVLRKLPELAALVNDRRLVAVGSEAA